MRANRFSASQKIPHILWNPTVHHRFHKCPPPVPVLSQIDSVHALSLNIVLPSPSWSSKWSLSLRFPHQNPIYAPPVPHICYMPCSSHSFQFHHPITLGEEYRSLSSSLYSFLHPRYLVSPRPKYSPQHLILQHPQPVFLLQCE